MPGTPNILIVVVDDMGVHQLGCYGSAFYETPSIDRLAREGARFPRAYCASPVCSPSRAALYTGLHPARLHLTNFIPGTAPANARLLTPAWRAHLPVDVTTLGDAFKANGYVTGHFGKWHLAPDYHYEPGRAMDPESQGFDEVLVTRKPLASADPEGDPHHIDRITDRAIEFTETAGNQGPFLCVIAHNALHRPEMAPRAQVEYFAGKRGAELDCNRPVVAAMTARVDASVGRLMEALRKSGSERETIVVFTADHGAFGQSAERKPLRGAKADLYEGGVRVPFVIHWPSRIPAGDRQGAVFGTDLFPTLLDLARLPAPATTDGLSLCRELFEPAVPLAQRELYWHFPHYHHLGLGPCGAVLAGRWKLIEWFDRTIGGQESGPPFELFDLETDPREECDVATAQPARVRELAHKLVAWRRSVGAQEMLPNPKFDPAGPNQSAPPPPGDPGNPYGE
jgi:arylsulfatase A-like enzyme